MDGEAREDGVERGKMVTRREEKSARSTGHEDEKASGLEKCPRRAPGG